LFVDAGEAGEFGQPDQLAGQLRCGQLHHALGQRQRTGLTVAAGGP
jgi:hypothetical protein